MRPLASTVAISLIGIGGESQDGGCSGERFLSACFARSSSLSRGETANRATATNNRIAGRSL